ncbi:MAG: AAA family ATPase [Labilithrix sp.]|nr:AAA family ATPase [Labilithrix sp.]MCW5817004.1 AAA family ATPase [Labilithrix sp.]
MIKRLKVSRFRSLGNDVTIDFGPLTVLVGQNGAGKSNTIDALVFLADCMHLGLEGAITKRSGIGAIRHAGSGGRPYDVTIGVEIEREDVRGTYEVVLAGERAGEYRVKRELASIERGATFVVENGQFTGPANLNLVVEPTALALTALAGEARFAPLAQSLRSIASYSIFPDALRTPQKYDPRRPMDRQGTNWVSILKDQPEASWKPDLLTVLRKLTGDLADVKFEPVAGFLVLQFKHERDAGAKRKQWFDAAQESDGTLRVAGMMTALLQEPRPELIAIEEPELTVHPGALRLLHDYIREGALRGQVVLTTHSPDLLSLLSAEEVRVVTRVDDETRVEELDEAQRDVVTRGLFSLGDVMRSEGLRPQQLALPLGAE